VETDSARRAPTLTLTAAESRASGFAGCNQFTGGYELSGDRFTVGPLVMTRMFCEGRMEVEDAYSSALGEVTGIRVVDGALELLAGERVVVRATRGS